MSRSEPSGGATGSVLNPEAKVRVDAIGTERRPVIVIDDVLAEPARWRAAAEASRYQPIGPHYPGIRSPVPPAPALALCAGLAPLIARTFALDPVPPLFECFFSIVTLPPERLAPIQRLPHVDGLERARLAVLIYLSDAGQGGTAFYRQRGTGFETVDRARFPAFDAMLREGVARHGLPPAAYIAGNTPVYEQIARYDARPNRALIYHSHALHCAAIPPGATLPADPATGRLSINAFLFDPGAQA